MVSICVARNGVRNRFTNQSYLNIKAIDFLQIGTSMSINPKLQEGDTMYPTTNNFEACQEGLVWFNLYLDMVTWVPNENYLRIC